MAYDPEARSQSNSALIIGLVALLVVVGAAMAYFSTSSSETPSPIVMTQPATQHDTVVQPVPVPVPNSNPSTVVVTPPTKSTTRTESSTTTVHEHVVTPPASSPSGSESSSETNVTVNGHSSD